MMKGTKCPYCESTIPLDLALLFGLFRPLLSCNSLQPLSAKESSIDVDIL